jgi:hypothetical protein
MNLLGHFFSQSTVFMVARGRQEVYNGTSQGPPSLLLAINLVCYVVDWVRTDGQIGVWW